MKIGKLLQVKVQIAFNLPEDPAYSTPDGSNFFIFSGPKVLGLYAKMFSNRAPII
jgi:hypothetical protein